MQNSLINIKYFFFLILFQLLTFHSFSQEYVRITDFGVNPDDTVNVVPAFNKALRSCAGKEDPVLLFPEGTYHFRKESAREVEPGMLLNGIQNITIDGEGSEFVFHGKMQVVSMYNCRNIILKNFSVDWQNPFISQGELLETGDNYIDVGIDREQYPYVIEGNSFLLNPAGEKIQPVSAELFVYDEKTKVYTVEGSTHIKTTKVKEIKPGIVRFYGSLNKKPKPGSKVKFLAVDYIATGISIVESKDILLKDIIIHHALGDGIASARSENITLNNANVLINKDKDRIFSVLGNATHFISCRGNINISECKHTGTGGFFTKIHGEYVSIDSVPGSNVVTSSQFYSIRPGESVWFVESDTYQRTGSGIIRHKQPIVRNNRIEAAGIMFSEAVPGNLDRNDFLESKEWIPRVRINNCNIPQNNKSGGINVNIPGSVIIEENHFRNVAPAILINGSPDSLKESGACDDVTIRNNKFEECLVIWQNSSEINNSEQALISILPDLKPLEAGYQPFHKNILIENNIFRTSSLAVLNCSLTTDLIIKGNRIEVTENCEPDARKDPFFYFNACQDIIVKDNEIHKHYQSKSLKIKNMNTTQIQAEGFKIQLE